MSQCRKNLTRGKVIKVIYQNRMLVVNKQVGRRMPHPELSRLQFYNQGKSGEWEKTTFFLILEQMSSYHHQFLLIRCGSCLSLHGENGTIIALFKSAERWSMLKMVNHIRFWYNVTLSLYFVISVHRETCLCNQQLVVLFRGMSHTSVTCALWLNKPAFLNDH